MDGEIESAAEAARIMAQAEAIVRSKAISSKYTWTGKAAPRERKPLATAVPWSASYGPHICPACYGAGWMRDQAEVGKLHKCETCMSVEQQAVNRQLATCWEVGKIKETTPKTPTFDTFDYRDPAAAAALKVVHEFARLPQKFVTLYGTYGSGKSHLAEAAARSLLQRRQPCLYINASNLFEYLGAIHRADDDDTDYTGRMTWCVYIKVLIIDELNMEGNSKAVADLRRSLIDARYQRAISGEGGATMLISNTAPEGWHDQAVASRAQDSRFTCIESTKVDFRRVQR